MRINADTRAKDLTGASELVHLKGFSLIELLSVIAIAGIMMGIALPAYSTWISHNSVNSAVSALMSKLKQARNIAVAQSRSVKITFNTGTNSFVYDADTAGTCGSCKNQTVLLSQFSSNIALTKTGGNKLTFSSRGTALPKTITITNGAYSRAITVNIIGRSYVN